MTDGARPLKEVSYRKCTAQAGEGGLSLHGRAAARVPLTLRCLLAESAAAALMTRCQLAEAQPHILAALTAVQQFPTLLAPLRSSASALAGGLCDLEFQESVAPLQGRLGIP